jgi:hypothetical protein
MMGSKSAAILTLQTLAVAGTALLAACGDGGGPTTPTPAARETGGALGVASGPAALGDTALTGIVRDSLTRLPVAGARVEAGELAEVVADRNGSFSIPLRETGVISLVARSDGYFPHETHASTGSPARIEIELIPQNGHFDLDFYDHVFRNLGQRGTNTWATQPGFEVLMRVFDCVDHSSTDACDVFEATNETAPGKFVSLAREVVAADVSRLTGGALLGSDVRLVDVTPGTRITRTEAWVQDDIRFLIARLPEGSSWATRWLYRGTSNYYSGLIVINKVSHKADRGAFSHELAHTLGFDHPLGGDQVPLPSIIRWDDRQEPTPADILHGAILYRRPAGSRTPDRDPDDFVLNGLRQLPAGPGELIEETVR